MYSVKYILFIILLIPSLGFGATYYVKNGGNNGNTGLSDAQAWATLAYATTNISDADDLYLKCGSTWEERLVIQTNNTIVGAYYVDGSETIGVNVDGKPIIDGDSDEDGTGDIPTTGSGNTGLVVNYIESPSDSAFSDITIQDIKVQYSGQEGIEIRGLSGGSDSGILIQRCDTYRNYYAGVTVWGEISDVTVTGMYSNEDAYSNCLGSSNSPAIRVRYLSTAGWAGGTPTNITISDNVIYDSCREVINAYRVNGNLIFENNLVYGTKMVNNIINVTGMWEGVNGTSYIRHNLIFQESAIGNASAIVLGDTDQTRSGENPSGSEIYDIHIYDNMVAACNSFITFARQSWIVTNDFENIFIYNNTVIDCDTLITFNTVYRNIVSGTVYVKNNVFWNFSDDFPRCSGQQCDAEEEVSEIIWDYNTWDSEPPSILQGGNDPGYPTYSGMTSGLTKTSGWRSISGLGVNVSDFIQSINGSGYLVGSDLGDTYDDGLSSVALFDLDPYDFSLLYLDRDLTGWSCGAGILFGAEVSGTVVAYPGYIPESGVVDGGGTIILTLSGTTWDADIGTDCAETTALIGGIESAQSETYGWNNIVLTGLDYEDVVRTDDITVTITLPAFPTFNITANEYITSTIAAICTAGSEVLVASETILVSADVDEPETPPSGGAGDGKVGFYSSNGLTTIPGNVSVFAP